MPGRNLDDYVAAGDAIVKAFQTLDMLSHARLDCRRRLHVSERNSQRGLH
jgi:hypothetical protein